MRTARCRDLHKTPAAFISSNPVLHRARWEFKRKKKQPNHRFVRIRCNTLINHIYICSKRGEHYSPGVAAERPFNKSARKKKQEMDKKLVSESKMCAGFCRLFKLCTHCTLEWRAFYRSDAPYLFLDHDPTPFLFLDSRVMKKEKLAEVPWRNFERTSFESSRCTPSPPPAHPLPITHHPSLHDNCACTSLSPKRKKIKILHDGNQTESCRLLAYIYFC